MRLKTFIATYVLFLSILFISLGVVSVYLTNSQTDMLKDRSIGEYHSIAATLSKDIAVLIGRSGGIASESGGYTDDNGGFTGENGGYTDENSGNAGESGGYTDENNGNAGENGGYADDNSGNAGESGGYTGSSGSYAGIDGIGADFANPVKTLVNGYIQYYRKYNIEIAVSIFTSQEYSGNGYADAEISFTQREQGHFIHIIGRLPAPSDLYRLDYYLDITKNVMDMRNIQNTLLIFAAAFSVFTAFALYFILSYIFKPLGIVAGASTKIADGQYSERLKVKGKNELSSMASSFNRMAEEIEKQITVLEDEALGKQQFADNLAHEIRTPLTSIYGYAEYMQKTSLCEEEIIDSAQHIMDEAGHMNKIADSLLELATLRNYTPIKSKISITRLFGEIYRSMEKSLHEKNVRFMYRNECEDEILDGQEDLLRSLLMNLCSNALKSCSPYEGVIHLKAKEQEEEIIISVKDNGCGIPEDKIAKVAEPFYRVDKARSREEGGAGLGLTLCKQIAEAHGAKMVIESAVGMGTRVKIIFTSP